MDKQIKDGIEEYIGHKRLLTQQLQEQILSSNRQPIRRYKRNFQYIFNSAIVLVVFGAFIFFLVSEKESIPETSPPVSGGALEKENIDLKAKLKLSERFRSQKEEEIEALQEEIEALQKEIGRIYAEAPIDYSMMSNYLLQSIGFTGGVEAVRADLVKHPELIPYEGSLGGTMQFSEGSILVLSHKWVFAPFSDGHAVGHLLLTYEINDGEVRNWQVVESHLDGEQY